MKIAISTIDFLGAVIGEGTIKLQPHIIKKIVNFNEEELKTKKGLRSFLGILNYARNHIPNLDGCMEGWGGIVKWKKSKGDSRSSEKNCAYASGKFSTTQSTIDAEINACINTLKRMHRRNKAISSSSSLFRGREIYSRQCLSEEYEDHLRRNLKDFQPLPRIFTKAIFTHEEPGALYRYYQLKTNQAPIRMDKSNAWRAVAQDIELSAAKEAVKAMRSLQAII
ncbi:hypothetical protein Tco_0315766 [Tanacetum coccineum]